MIEYRGLLKDARSPAIRRGKHPVAKGETMSRSAWLIAAVALAVAPAAYADQLRSGSMCLAASGGRAVLTGCGAGTDVQFAGYGAVRSNGQCLSTSGGQGSPVIWTSCNNSTAQKWALSGRLNNEQGWCAEAQGSSVTASTCNGRSNQAWTKTAGAVVPAPSLATRAWTLDDVRRTVATQRNLSLSQAQGIVAQGGGNFNLADVVKIVAQGGGNIISNDGASLRAQANGTLVGNSGGTFAVQGNNIISTNSAGMRR